MVEYDGTIADEKLNPVYSLLLEYDKMHKNDILSHIQDWWFNADCEKLFNESVESGIIIKSDNRWIINES